MSLCINCFLVSFDSACEFRRNYFMSLTVMHVFKIIYDAWPRVITYKLQQGLNISLANEKRSKEYSKNLGEDSEY